MKKSAIDEIFGNIGNLVPPKIDHSTKKENIKNKKGERILKAPELGKLLGMYEYKDGLIKSMELRAWGAEYNFYNTFIEYAVNYFDVEVEEADYLTFFSFTPQYSQMNFRQLQYYLHWRTKFRKGECIKTDFSYIMLFIYEVINLPPHLLPPKKGVKYLGYLWMKYRAQYPQLDKYLSEWMADYCLVHSVECPAKYIKGFYHDILKNTTLPEFYLNNSDFQSAEAELLNTCSDYDFSKSRHINDENRDIYRRHINGALKNCFFANRDIAKPTLVSCVRDSYVGALCLYENKRRMTLTYYKLERADIDAVDATEAVKYAESLVRSGLGLRPRKLDIKLSPQIKNRIDCYFMNEITSFKNPTEKLQEVGEKRYEPESVGFSQDEAHRIELESRATAELLEGTLEAEEIPSAPAKNTLEPINNESANDAPEAQNQKAEEAPNDIISSLKLIYEGKYKEFIDFCRSKGLLPEAMIEEINYFAFLKIDDIVLEADGDEYRVINDYTKEVEEWLKI